MHHTARLLLFDLDGTLLRSNGAGRRALDAAFRERFPGWAEPTEGVSFAGATDALIVEEVFARRGLDATAARAARRELLDRYVEHLGAILRAELGTVQALAGVVPLLERLRGEPVAGVGVLTGNVEGGARLKVEAAGLPWSFDVGAFGDEAETRVDLLPLALTRHAERTGVRLAPAAAVIVGDTPKDVAVARAHGARAVAVATGFAPRAALVASEPDVLLDDLADLDAALAALLE